MRHFDQPLPIDAVLGDLTARLRDRSSAVLVAPPGAGKTTRVPLVLLDEALGRGRQADPARTAPPRRPRRGGAHGADARTKRSASTVGLRVRLGSKVSSADPDRGGDRGRVLAHDPRRPDARRRRRRALRRVPRALPRRRSRPRSGARRPGRIAGGSASPRHVRDPRRRPRRPASRRCARGRDPRAAPSRSRPAISAAIRAGGIEDQVADAVTRALRAEPRIDPGLPAGPGRDPTGRGAAARAHRRSRDRHRAALRRPGPGRAGPGGAAGRPGRRKVVLATSIAENVADHRGRAGGDRFGPCPRAGLRARYRPHAAGDRAGFARGRRSAPGPRRTDRARHLLPALGGGGERRARAVRPARRSSRRIWHRSSSIAPPGG